MHWNRVGTLALSGCKPRCFRAFWYDCDGSCRLLSASGVGFVQDAVLASASAIPLRARHERVSEWTETVVSLQLDVSPGHPRRRRCDVAETNHADIFLRRSNML